MLTVSVMKRQATEVLNEKHGHRIMRFRKAAGHGNGSYRGLCQNCHTEFWVQKLKDKLHFITPVNSCIGSRRVITKRDIEKMKHDVRRRL